MVGIEAALRVETDGLALRIDGHANVLTCRLDGDGKRLLTTLRHARRFLALLRMIVPLLIRAGIELEIVVGTTRLARAGSGVRQNTPARLLRLPFVRIGA